MESVAKLSKEIMKRLTGILVAAIVSCLAISVASRDIPLEPESRIIGGKFAKDGQFPYVVRVVAFGGVWSETELYSCGGSIIGPKWVLTAGHCYTPTTNDSEPITYLIEAGSIKSGEPRQSDIVINSNAFQHPKYYYDGITVKNDLALLKTARWTIDEYVCPIPIALGSWSAKSYIDEKLLVMGFGYISNDGPVSEELRWTKLTVISKKKCQKFYEERLHKSAFCAVDKKNKPIERSTCSGDSGGPAIIEVDKKLVQVGIVSFSHDDGCDVAPTGYTDVAMFHDWITLTMAMN